MSTENGKFYLDSEYVQLVKQKTSGQMVYANVYRISTH